MYNPWDGSLCTRLGFAGGLMLTVVATASSADLCRTVLLAIVGAVVSFIVTLLMKQLLKWYHRRNK